MPNFTIQTDYTIDIETEQQIEQEDNYSNDFAFKLVTESDFVELFKKNYPLSTDDPNKLWHIFLGNKSSEEPESINKEVHFLTNDSCEKILQYYPLFKSGIDFNHLPVGFFIVKNPHADGIRDVLHYSDFLAKQQKSPNSLSITLSEKPVIEHFETHDFKDPESQWYEFLRSKMQSGPTTFCTENELKKAFITFSNSVTRLGLKFESTHFDTLNSECNPIVLLGRWNTILTQENLKKSDLQTQFKYLPLLPLTSGYGALRAVSDYLGTERPCGFVLPEMFKNHQFHDCRHERNVKQLDGLSDIWRYIAYQPKRNSLDYYRQAMSSIEKMKLTEYQKKQIITILVASSTGRSHNANTKELELIELGYWNKFCMLVDGIASSTASMKLISKAYGSDLIKNNFIFHLQRFTELPNIHFLHSIALCIQKYIQDLSVGGVALALAQNVDPLRNLAILSEKLDLLITEHGTNVYQGAQFYFVDGHWVALGVQKYTELLYLLRNHCITFLQPYGNPAYFYKILTPFLSTFNLLQEQDINEILSELRTYSLNLKTAEFCFSLFKEATSQCSKKDLIDIICYIKTHSSEFHPLIDTVNFVETHFSTKFPESFFTKKIKQLEDSKFGLNEEQIDAIHQLKLSADLTQMLIETESALVRHNASINSSQLNKFNEQLIHLNRLLGPADFLFFIEKIHALKEQLPNELAVLSKLVELLSHNRSITLFRQIHFCNQIEKCSDKSLITKYIFFIKQLKNLAIPLKSISTTTTEELVASWVLNSDVATIERPEFTEKVAALFKAMDFIISHHPHLQHSLLHALAHVSGKYDTSYFSNVNDFIQCMENLVYILPPSNDEVGRQNMLSIYSLLAKLKNDPAELISIWETIAKLKKTPQKAFMLRFINKLLDNDQNITGLGVLVDSIVLQPNLLVLLEKVCSKPPYPDIPTINDWIQNDRLEEKYHQFSMKPYGERRLDFAFSREQFDTQKTLFEGVGDGLFTDNLANNLHKLLENNRAKNIQELRNEFAALVAQNINPLHNDQKLALLCIAVEMLARTAAQWDDRNPPQIISQEVNATQVMALYAMLVNPGNKLISELGTGEGKSRINMILAACEAAQGKTIDFMTSDMSLAERDFLSYNAFFSSLGLRTSLISLNTPKQLYQRGGINFTDNSQLLLLRNRSDIALDPYAFLEEDPSKRGVIIDEFDKFLHDKAKDAYNFAAPSKSLKEFTWIYPLLIQFVSTEIDKNLDEPFVGEKLTEEFVKFVAIHDIDELHQANAATLNDHHKQQLITWINSAHTALKMKSGTDYILSEDREDKLKKVRDADGFTRYTREIFVLDSGRPIKGSTFALGVHQCLCAIENKKTGKQSFLILPENETQRTSYPITFMAKYENGIIYGASGTARHEAPTSSDAINYDQFSYMIVPRHKKVIREDKNIWLAKDETQQIDFLKKLLLEKLSQDPQIPILLICRNDQQSQTVHDLLVKDEELQLLMKKCTRVHGLTEKTDEVQAIKEAGIEGNVTISTVGMFGRGVDINAANLFVSSLYIPTFEDEKQIKGRTGRAGKPGEFRMLLDMTDPECPVKGNTYNIENEVHKIQQQMALQSVHYEEVTKLYALFLEHVTNNFLEDYKKTPEIKRLELLEKWQKYLGNMQKDWDIKRLELLQCITEDQTEEFKATFTSFKSEWETKLNFINQEHKTSFVTDKANTVYAAIAEQKGFFKNTTKPTKMQSEYDIADDGQARVYNTFFAQERAILQGKRPVFADYQAWKEGRGSLFPDLMATLHGDRPLFATLRATIARLIAELKAWWAKKQNPDFHEEHPTPLDDSDSNTDDTQSLPHEPKPSPT